MTSPPLHDLGKGFFQGNFITYSLTMISHLLARCVELLLSSFGFGCAALQWQLVHHADLHCHVVPLMQLQGCLDQYL